MMLQKPIAIEILANAVMILLAFGLTMFILLLSLSDPL